MQTLYDVAIIGGGPAGSAAAIRLAREGRRVVVLERDRFPRFKIGESLLPYSMEALERLGMKEWLEQHAEPKYGGEVATACGSRQVKFYFSEGFDLAFHSAYQVERAPFDAELLRRAEEAGAEVRQQTRVEAAESGAEEVTLTLAGGERLRARYVIDAGGRNSVVGSRYGEREDYPHLRKFSAFAHFRGVQREGGRDGGLTRLVRGDENWFWFIPLDAERTSVGVVMEAAEFRRQGGSPEEALARAMAESAVVSERMAGAERISPVSAAGDYSYRHRRLTGERWLLAGDAAGFIDPIFSTGVFLALLSGERCAEALHLILEKPSRRAGLFRRYERDLHAVMDMYLRFVTAWYGREFIEVFTTPAQRFQLAPAINAVLAGNIGRSFRIWWRMQLFYLVLRLQKKWPLCPRVARPLNRPRPAALTEQAA